MSSNEYNMWLQLANVYRARGEDDLADSIINFIVKYMDRELVN